MGTWHQKQANKREPIPLYHPTKYTVVNDSPNGVLTVSRFKDAIDAQRYADRNNGYVLPPNKE